MRVEEGPDGTFGAVVVDEEAFCVCLELPDKDNAPDVSNIPPGSYQCQQYASKKFGLTYEVLGVPGRFGILLHAGNTVADTRGCILLGQHWGKLRSATDYNRAVLNSGNTFAAFMARLRGVERFDLEIIEVL